MDIRKIIYENNALVVTKYIDYHLRVVPLSNCCSTITQSREKVFTLLKLAYAKLIYSVTAEKKKTIFAFNVPIKMHLKYILQLLHSDMFRHDRQ